MSLLFSGLVLRPARRRPLRTAAAIAGVAVGVAAIAAIRRANRSVTESFRGAVAAISGSARLTVEGVDGVPDETGRRLSWLWDAGAAFAPVVDRFAVAADGTDEPVEVLGVDVTAEDPVRRYRLEGEPAGDLRALFAPEAAFAAAPFARRHRLARGARFPLWVRGVRRTVTIAGILEPIGPARASAGQLLVTGLRTAQRLFGIPGRVDRLDVAFPPNVSEAEIAGRLARSLPPGVFVSRPAARADAADEMVRAYRFNLAALGSIALLVGVFLIYNTLSMAVIRRWPEIGTLRAIGASRKAIFGSILAEGLAIGAIGTAAGEALGVLLTRALLPAVSTTVVDIYRTTARVAESGSIEPLLVSAAVGLGASLLAAWAPAAEAARVAPASILRPGTIERRRRRRAPALAGVALACAAAGAGLAFLPPVRGFPFFGFLAVGCAIGALAAATVPAVLVFETVLRRPLARLFGAPGRLAASFFGGNVSRNAVAIAALALALGMAAAMAVMIASLRQTVVDWVNASVASDLFVKSATGGRRGIVGTLPAEAIAFLEGIPGVASVDPFRTIDVRDARGRPFTIGAGDFAVAARTGSLRLLSGRDPASVFARARADGNVFVSEPFARRFRVGRGSRVELPTPAGPRSFEIADVYPDYSNDRGTVVLDRPRFIALFRDPDVSTIAIRAGPGISPEALRDRILGAARGRFAFSILTNRTLRADVLRIFDRTFAVTDGLEAIAVVVAVLGVVHALFALVLERRRELALLRVLGTTRAQLRVSIALEAGLIGLAALALSAAAATAFAALLILVINPQSFGWSIRLDVPWREVAAVFALALAATLAASIAPARLAVARDAAAAVREE